LEEYTGRRIDIVLHMLGNPDHEVLLVYQNMRDGAALADPVPRRALIRKANSFLAAAKLAYVFDNMQIAGEARGSPTLLAPERRGPSRLPAAWLAGRPALPGGDLDGRMKARNLRNATDCFYARAYVAIDPQRAQSLRARAQAYHRQADVIEKTTRPQTAGP